MDHPAPTASGQVSPFSEQWQTATNETQRLQNEEGNVRINETASGQDGGGGNAAGRTPAMPKETGSQDDDNTASGQKCSPAEKITLSVTLNVHAAAQQSFLSDAAQAPMCIVKKAEGADENLPVPADPRKGRRSETKDQAACGPRTGEAGRASTYTIPVFPPSDRRSHFCYNAAGREALFSCGSQYQMWPPMLRCNFRDPERWTKQVRKEYNSKHGITPVYQVPAGGTLWLGNMHAASDASLLQENLISVRMSCLGGSMRKRKGDDWGGVKRSEQIWDMGPLDVDGILDGEVLMGVLWHALQQVDRCLESGYNVLIYCAHGARRSAFVTACYLKCKCRIMGEHYRHAAVIGHLQIVRRVVVDEVCNYLAWAWSYLSWYWQSPCRKTTLLPFIFKDEDFDRCCKRSHPLFWVNPGDRASGSLDQLQFEAASGQEDKGDQEGGGKEGKGNKNDTGERRETPSVAGQEGKGRGSKPPTAFGQEHKNRGDPVVNHEDCGGAKGKKRKNPELQALEAENQRLRQRIDQLEFTEECAAASKEEPALHQAVWKREYEKAVALIDGGSDVNGENSSGMTPLHCAARDCNVLMTKLLLEKGADANAITDMTTKPKGYCALALLADRPHRLLHHEDVQATAELLVGGMDMETFGAQTGTGRTAWHFLCDRGNHLLLDWLLDYFDNTYGREHLKRQLHLLEHKGKSVKDVAMSHAICRDLVHKKGGTNVHPPIKNRNGQRVPLGHKWHRQTRREWWPNQ